MVPNVLNRKRKSFRFVYYVADKTDFLGTVKKGWELDIKGCNMFKVINRLRYLKKSMNDLNWENGNLFDKVVDLKQQLKEVQGRMVADPFNQDIKKEVVEIHSYYTDAVKDELKLLHQTAKIKWLKEGDRNSTFFHSILKSRKNKDRVESICGEDGKRFEGKSGKFKYHYGCKELGRTYMCFADDLLILCNGDKDSIRVVKKVLNELSEVSGLLFNLNKSTIFFGSVNKGLKRELMQILPFKLGSPSMKYLRVPLIAKKLGVKDCKSLVDNMEKRINCWRNKMLSYTGRIELIASVLSSMHQYWASVYILPSAIIKDLDKLFKKFLWNSRNSAKGKARVTWNLICRPKDQGGLGPIRDIIPKSLLLEARFKGNKFVQKRIINGKWDWPKEWGVIYTILNQINVSYLKNNDDKVVWISNDDKEAKFSTKVAWLSLKENWPKVKWRLINVKGKWLGGWCMVLGIERCAR
nr:RNA-directed DNA polymerase, eukaryota, reverse transcriptase zinc-binding domain protein [Tanacetum cinerariifolium]